MPRLVDTLLSKSPFFGTDAPVIDIKKGGQFGHMMDYQALVSSSPYVRQHLIPILIQAPRGFELFADAEMWRRSLKAIIEEQSRSITGLDSTLNISNVEQDVGGAGEKIAAVSNVTRNQSQPNHSLYEKYNMPITTFINTWITELMMDPETKYPNIITRAGVDPNQLDHLVDFYSCTVLYIEPDPVFQKVVKAWLCTFVRPASTGPTMEGSRDLTGDKEGLEISLQMTATTQVGIGVNRLAQRILRTLSVTNTNPHQREAMYVRDNNDLAIEGNVQAITDAGYKAGMDTASATALPL